ncbi:zinc finger protein OZF-like [Lepus europaeus]|uniref:zinc finger protein OZF-like n=1 Tax=Lepus europaeus TaxID=9983 RepID=UPI002B49C830|nr:zinc finger protein OZF-like [Lepus europaeus]
MTESQRLSGVFTTRFWAKDEGQDVGTEFLLGRLGMAQIPRGQLECGGGRPQVVCNCRYHYMLRRSKKMKIGDTGIGQEPEQTTKLERVVYGDAGYCKSKPEVIFKLEQGAESWTVTKPLNRSLSAFHTGTNLSPGCPTCDAVPWRPDKMQAAEKSDGTNVPGNSSECWEPISQPYKIQTFQQVFEHSIRGKGFSRKRVFFTDEKAHMGDTCNKSVGTVGKTTEHGKKTFQKKSYHSKPQQTHTGKKLYESFEYEETLIYKSDFTTSQRTYTGKKIYSCNPCGKSFNCKSCLSIHHSTQKEQKPSGCNECGKSIYLRSDTTNLMIHSRYKSFACETCGKAFYWKSQLILHQRIHTGEKPYQCNTCGEGFHGKTSLISHQRIHTKEKSYKCDICRKAFSWKSNLTKVHINEKTYGCEMCGKTFCWKSNLTTHQRIHTGDKPFECNTCEKAFC